MKFLENNILLAFKIIFLISIRANLYADTWVLDLDFGTKIINNVPMKFTVKIKNISKENQRLEGKDLFFSIFPANHEIIYGKVNKLSNQKYRLSPGDVVEIPIQFNDLSFVNIEKKPLKSKNVLGLLKKIKWSTKIFIPDYDKPKNSSILLTYSNLIEFSKDVSKK